MAETALAPAALSTLSKENHEKYLTLIKEIPKDRQLSWLQLSNAKLQIEKKLQSKELELQALFLTLDTMDVAQLQVAIDKYKKGVEELVEIRKSFTKYTDNIATSLMVFEKRCLGFNLVDGKWIAFDDATLEKANKRFLELREELEEKKKKKNEKADELARLKLHVTNEYNRIASEYKIALIDQLTQAYIQALKDDLTDEGLQQYVNLTLKALEDVKVSSPAKYEYKLHTREELMPIYKAIPSPDYKAILEEVKKYVVTKFKLYWQDKKAGEAAVVHHTNSGKETIAAIKDKAETVNSVNALSITAEVITEDDATTIRAIKKRYKIVVENTPSWAKKIITLFLANWDDSVVKLKLKNFENLKVAQMAEALSQLEEQFPGLKYEEIKK